MIEHKISNHGVETLPYLCDSMSSAKKFIRWIVVSEEEWCLYSGCSGLLGHLVPSSKSVNHEREHRSSCRTTLHPHQQHLIVFNIPTTHLSFGWHLYRWVWSGTSLRFCFVFLWWLRMLKIHHLYNYWPPVKIGRNIYSDPSLIFNWVIFLYIIEF